MKIISIKLHGFLDYTVGAALAASPWLLGFYNGGPETWVPVWLGFSTILYSLSTDYPAGLIRKIPMSLHLTLDVLAALSLLVSPWIFSFADKVWVPHVVVGTLEVVVVLLTRSSPGSISDRSSYS